MMNYLKSEQYRLLRKKSLHITSLVCFALIAGAAAVLAYFQKTEPGFRYGTTSFYYSNVLGMTALIFIVSFLFNSSLTGRDTAVLKNAVSFGIRRSTIYWSKLLLTFGYLLVISIIGVALMLVLGETILITDDKSVRDFLTALVNMAPIILSAFLFIHSLKMMKVGDIYVFIVLLVIYGFSGGFLRVGAQKLDILRTFYDYAPDTLLGQNLLDFMSHTIEYGYEYWITGIVLSAAALIIGITKFSKQTID
ncbi:ABC-2 type transport system permease protein [Sporosarcina luteola]|nr:ABC-2 type transport system permease protein [Sporosarcina luteola]